MRRNTRLRLTIGLAMLIVFAALSTARTLQQAARAVQPGVDDVTAYGDQLEQVKALLPRVGQIGYVSDDDPSVFLKNYYLTQYFLTPLLVRDIDTNVSDNGYQIVLGKFSDIAHMNATLVERHLALVDRVDRNIFILKKAQ